MAGSILIKHDFIVTMEGDEVIEDGSIYIGDRISQVGKSDEVAERRAEHVIDASRSLNFSPSDSRRHSPLIVKSA